MDWRIQVRPVLGELQHPCSTNHVRNVAISTTRSCLLTPGRLTPKSGILSNIRYWYFVDLMAVCIHDGDEPSAPIPSRHNRAVFEATCQRYRILASGSIACEINAFVIIQNLSSVGEVEVVTLALRSDPYLRRKPRTAPAVGEAEGRRSARAAVCTENLIHVDEVAESPKLAQ